MSSTYSALYYHVIFGTHHREPLIASAWRNRLHEYLGGTIHGLGGVSCEIGRVADHVHLLVSLRPTQLVPDLVRELEKSIQRLRANRIRLASIRVAGRVWRLYG